MLPTRRELADMMDVIPMTISRWRKRAVEDGYLVKVKDHQFQSKGISEAADFRFNVGLYLKLNEKAQGGTAEHFQFVKERQKNGI
jgi:DNA-binding transcriptional regulator YhcF (GntR family)